MQIYGQENERKDNTYCSVWRTGTLKPVLVHVKHNATSETHCKQFLILYWSLWWKSSFSLLFPTRKCEKGFGAVSSYYEPRAGQSIESMVCCTPYSVFEEIVLRAVWCSGGAHGEVMCFRPHIITLPALWPFLCELTQFYHTVQSLRGSFCPETENIYTCCLNLFSLPGYHVLLVVVGLNSYVINWLKAEHTVLKTHECSCRDNYSTIMPSMWPERKHSSGQTLCEHREALLLQPPWGTLWTMTQCLLFYILKPSAIN